MGVCKYGVCAVDQHGELAASSWRLARHGIGWAEGRRDRVAQDDGLMGEVGE